MLIAERKFERFLQVGYNLRFLDSLVNFRQLLQSRVFGRVVSVQCQVGQFLPAWRPGSDYRLGVSANKHLGGGVLLEYSHEIDYLRWIFGEIEWVSAWTSTQSSLRVDVEDYAHLLFGFCQDSQGQSLLCSLNMDFIRHDKTRVCTAICEKGSIRWNGVTGVVESQSAGRGKWNTVYQSVQALSDTYQLQWFHFAHCIETNIPPKPGSEDGIAVLRIIKAARESSLRNGAKIFVASLVN